MKEYLFRGKSSCETREPYWIYGGLLPESKNTFPIIASDYDNDEEWIGIIEWATVSPETVGQFSGVVDDEGVQMFEGDIVEAIFLFGMIVPAVVTFKDGSFGLEWSRGEVKQFNPFTSMCNISYKVIGNIHDNPELLERSNEK